MTNNNFKQNNKFNKFNKYNNKNNTKKQSTKFQFSKNQVIAETENSILLRLKDFDFWLNKNIVFTSVYTNLLTVYVTDDWKFTCFNDKETFELTGKEFKNLMNLGEL